MVYQMLIAAMVLIIPALTGVVIVSWLHILKEKISLLTVGSMLGISAFGTLTYALAYAFPITPVSLGIELSLFVATTILLSVQGGLRTFLTARTDRIALWIIGISFILFSIIGNKLLIEKPDGLYTGIINAYGDIAWHGSIIMGLSEQNTLPLENPIFAGEMLTYPFLANLISTTMVVLGSSLTASVNVPAILLIPCILALMYFFGKQYGGSSGAGLITFILFLFGGATFGWIQFFSDITQSNVSPLQFLMQLPAEDYSGVGTSEAGFHFLNPVTTLLLPQRAMLFGIPLVLAVLILLHPKNIHKKYSALLAGILAGMLPLFHAHACIALATAVVALVMAYPKIKEWTLFFVPGLLIGIPEILFYTQGGAETGSFFRFGPFWMAGKRNPILYWLQNTGAYIPLSIAGLFLKVPKEAKAIALAGTFLFILANTFLFAPWAWDNFKLFAFWLIFILPLVSALLAKGFPKHSSIVGLYLAMLFILVHTFAAALDIYKLALPTARTYQEWDTPAIQIATAIAEVVPAHTPILTAPVHNSPVVLAGRTLFLGYAAHVWSHGKLPWDREDDIKRYYAGQIETIEGVQPTYILVGPQERGLVSSVAIRPEWSVVASTKEYTLYKSH